VGGAGLVTVTEVAPDVALYVAVTVDVPVDKMLAMPVPAPMVSTEGFEEVHADRAVTSALELSE
jgi:hypothetical protein